MIPEPGFFLNRDFSQFAGTKKAASLPPVIFPRSLPFWHVLQIHHVIRRGLPELGRIEFQFLGPGTHNGRLPGVVESEVWVWKGHIACPDAELFQRPLRPQVVRNGTCEATGPHASDQLTTRPT